MLTRLRARVGLAQPPTLAWMAPALLLWWSPANVHAVLDLIFRTTRPAKLLRAPARALTRTHSRACSSLPPLTFSRSRCCRFVQSGSCLVCPVSGSGVPVDSEAVYNTSARSCSCLNGLIPSYDYTSRVMSCVSCLPSLKMFVDGVGACRTCPEGESPFVSWDGTNCSCDSNYALYVNQSSGNVSCVCSDMSSPPRYLNGSSSCVTCNTTVPGTTFSTGTCSCSPAYDLVTDGATQTQRCSCGELSPARYLGAGFCQICPVAGSGVQIDSNAAFSSGNCSCGNGFSLSQNASGVASCVCSAARAFTSESVCYSCPATAALTNSVCTCPSNLTLVLVALNASASCLCQGNNRFPADSRCWICPVAGTPTPDPNASYSESNSTCSCGSGYVMSFDNATGRVSCTQCPAFSFRVDQTCYTCPVAGSSVAVDPEALFSNGVCSCQAEANLVLNNATLAAFCDCIGTPEHFLSGGLCYRCPVGTDLNANFSAEACSCNNGYVRTLTSSPRQVSCSCPPAARMYELSGRCYDCPADPSASWNVATRQCTCNKGFTLSASACICPTSPGKFQSGSTCYTCPVSGSGVSVDANAVFSNGTCSCIAPYSAVFDSVSGQVTCVNNACVAPYRFAAAGSCWTCPIAGNGLVPVDLQAQLFNGTCNCGSYLLKLISSTSSAACTCLWSDRRFARGACFECPVNASFNSGVCSCPTDSVLESTFIPETNNYTSVCSCSQTGRYRAGGVCFTCPISGATNPSNGAPLAANARAAFNNGTCSCTGGYTLVENNSTKISSCACVGANRFTSGGICFQCASTRQGPFLGAANWNAATSTCSCSSGVLTVNASTAVVACACSSDIGRYYAEENLCAVCPLLSSGIRDYRARLSNGTCSCVDGFEYVLNRATNVGSCVCPSQQFGFLNYRGNCVKCPTQAALSAGLVAAADPYAIYNATSRSCTCPEGFYSDPYSIPGAFRCGCAGGLYNGTCYSCGSSSTYNSVAKTCDCFRKFETVLDPVAKTVSCTCSGVGRVVSDGQCAVCAIPGSGVALRSGDVNPRLTNGICTCSNGFALTRELDGNRDILRCTCTAWRMFQYGASCLKCPESPFFQYDTLNNTCQCLALEMTVNTTTGAVDCQCAGPGKFIFKKYYCETCPAAGPGLNPPYVSSNVVWANGTCGCANGADLWRNKTGHLICACDDPKEYVGVSFAFARLTEFVM